MERNEVNLDPPRTLKGRRCGRIWRELAAKLAAADQLHAASRALLSAYAAVIAEIDENPNEVNAWDLKAAQQLGRALGLTK